MKMDKNSVIGFILIAILVVGFMWFQGKEQQAALKIQQHTEDSLRIVRMKRAADSTAAVQSIAAAAGGDTAHKGLAVKAGTSIETAILGSEELTIVENKLFKATFTNKGGRLKSVALKNFKSPVADSNVVLSGGPDGSMGYTINTGKTTHTTAELYFAPGKVATAADGTQTVSFTLADSTGQGITHLYTIKPNDYLINWDIDLNGATTLLPQGVFNFQWQAHPQQHEKSATYERQQSNICFYEDNNFDYISSKNSRTFEKPVQWIGIVQQFFNTTVTARAPFNFSAGEVEWKRATDTSKLLGDITVNLQNKTLLGNHATVPLQLYYGPTDFSILSKQPVEDMAKMVNLGRDLYSFVRPINRFIIMPVFGFFSGIVGNLGWAILLLTLFIRLVTSPLTYTSYLSGAKMKVLRPELDKIKAKTGDNQQAFAMEQMKLFREAGVNPLGGCIPALLQIPIFFALFSFFNSNINLRGVHFLWVKDLSSFDALFHFGDLPIIGDHVGLFTLTAILTSFLISIYNMSNTPQQTGPNAAAMKYMPYIFPFILFFVFNKLPSALTWYYTVSNIITLALQFVIQNYIINHDKILAAIEVKRKAPKTQSKFQERYAQVVETQKKVQELKNKQGGKK